MSVADRGEGRLAYSPPGSSNTLGLGFVLGPFWPLILFGVLVVGKLTTLELQQRVAERDTRIAELERRLGIRS